MRRGDDGPFTLLAEPDPAMSPLPLDTVDILSSIHTHRDPTAVARALGVRQAKVERSLRSVSRRHPGVLDARRACLTPHGLALVSASRRYHVELTQLSRPRTRDYTTLRLAAFGSGYNALARSISECHPASSWALNLTETTPQNAVHLLDTGAVAAAYVWAGTDTEPTRQTYRYDIASETLSIAGPHHWVDGVAREQARTIDKIAWATTPSGLPLLREALRRFGVTEASIEVVDCVMMVRSLVTRGTHATLVSPLSELAGVRTTTCPIPFHRRLRLHVDPHQLSSNDAEQLAHSLSVSYRDLALQRGVGSREYENWSTGHRTSTCGPVSSAPAPDPLRVASMHDAEDTLVLAEDDLAQLRAIRDSGSVNQAAKNLLITQPALSRRVRRLEARLSLTLLIRGTTGSRLSPAAEELLRHSDRALQRFHCQIGAQRAG